VKGKSEVKSQITEVELPGQDAFHRFGFTSAI
jgi:hypothetical protein